MVKAVRKRHLLLAVPLGVAVAFVLAAVSLAGGPTVEATGGGYAGYYWSPSTAEVASGESVAFKSPSGTVPHGVVWTGGPEAPSCTGVPIDSSGYGWSGACTFAKAGTYSFKCYVHPEMTGTVTVTAGGTVPATPGAPPPGSPESPASGPLVRSLELPKSQRGDSVEGSIILGQAAVGGRLAVSLYSPRSALLAGGRGKVRVGHLVRSPLDAGRTRFSVAITRAARRALSATGGPLHLRVDFVVAPVQGATVTMTRSLLLYRAR